MQTNTQITVHNTYQNTVQIAKIKLAKKCITNFDIAKQKKSSNNTWKKRNVNKLCIKKDFVGQKHVACAQKCKYGLPCQTNLANDACQQNFSQNQHFLKQKNNQLIFFKK